MCRKHGKKPEWFFIARQKIDVILYKDMQKNENSVWHPAQDKGNHNGSDHLQHISLHFYAFFYSVDRLLAWNLLRLELEKYNRVKDNNQEKRYNTENYRQSISVILDKGLFRPPFTLQFSAVCIGAGEECWGGQGRKN